MLLGIDGADHYGTSTTPMLAGAYAGANIAPSTSRPRNGTHSFRYTGVGGGENRRVVLQGSQNVFGLGGAYFLDALPDSTTNVYFQECRNGSNAVMVRLKPLPSGALRVETGNIFTPTTVVDSDVGVVTAGEYNHIEARYTFNGASGAIEVRRNGVTVIDATGVNIGAAGTMQIFAWGVEAGTWGGTEFCLDDLFWWNDAGSFNNDFLGDRVAIFLNPDGDQAASDWVRNTGSNDFETIDDLAPDGDTTYIEASNAADRSEFTLTNLAAEIVAVVGLCAYTYAKKSDSGDGSLQLSMLSADVGSPAAPAADAGDDHTVGESYGYFIDVYEADPATGALWTPTALNAARIRLERTL